MSNTNVEFILAAAAILEGMDAQEIREAVNEIAKDLAGFEHSRGERRGFAKDFVVFALDRAREIERRADPLGIRAYLTRRGKSPDPFESPEASCTPRENLADLRDTISMERI